MKTLFFCLTIAVVVHQRSSVTTENLERTTTHRAEYGIMRSESKVKLDIILEFMAQRTVVFR